MISEKFVAGIRNDRDEIFLPRDNHIYVEKSSKFSVLMKNFEDRYAYVFLHIDGVPYPTNPIFIGPKSKTLHFYGENQEYFCVGGGVPHFIKVEVVFEDLEKYSYEEDAGGNISHHHHYYASYNTVCYNYTTASYANRVGAFDLPVEVSSSNASLPCDYKMEFFSNGACWENSCFSMDNVLVFNLVVEEKA